MEKADNFRFLCRKYGGWPHLDKLSVLCGTKSNFCFLAVIITTTFIFSLRTVSYCESVSSVHTFAA